MQYRSDALVRTNLPVRWWTSNNRQLDPSAFSIGRAMRSRIRQPADLLIDLRI